MMKKDEKMFIPRAFARCGRQSCLRDVRGVVRFEQNGESVPGGTDRAEVFKFVGNVGRRRGR